MKTLLLNPGPVTLTARVRQSLLQPDLCHRESEFYDLQDEARGRLLNVYRLDPQRWSAVLMTASGTGAVESMIASLVPRQGRLLIVQNGVYGERIAAMAKQYGIEHVPLVHDWMAAPDPAAIARCLDTDGPFTHVAIVHHETTTGRLNGLREIGALCGSRGVRLLVDAVSSFGAEAIDFDEAHIDAGLLVGKPFQILLRSLRWEHDQFDAVAGENAAIADGCIPERAAGRARGDGERRRRGRLDEPNGSPDRRRGHKQDRPERHREIAPGNGHETGDQARRASGAVGSRFHRYLKRTRRNNGQWTVDGANAVAPSAESGARRWYSNRAPAHAAPYR